MADEDKPRNVIHPAAFVVDTETLRTVVREAVSDSLSQFGMFPSDAERVRADMIYLRQWREMMGTVKQAGLTAAVKWITLAMIALLLLGLGAKFGLKLPLGGD